MNRNAVVIVALAVTAFLFMKYWGRDDAVVSGPKLANREVPKVLQGEIARKERPKPNQPGPTDVVFEDDPKGDLRLEGQVINSTEDPVAGAVVSIDSRPPRLTQTDEDGAFFFDDLVARRYQVVARAQEGVAGPVLARLSADNDPVILVVAPGAKVEVVVTTKDNPEGVSGATVQLRGIETRSENSDGAGTVEFAQVPAGRYLVSAELPGYAPARTRISISRGGATSSVQLGLKSGAQVRGVVLTPAGTPLAGARVMYSGASNWSLQADSRLDGVITDRSGTFTVSALPGGTFRFRATADGYAPGTSDLISLDGESPRGDVQILLEAGATLSGIVKSVDGIEVPAARVRVSRVSAGMGGGSVRQVYTDKEGKFTLGGVARRVHELVAIHESASSDIVRTDVSIAPYRADLALVLDVDGVIAGVVVDGEGAPVSGAQVTVIPDFSKGARTTNSQWRMRGLNREVTNAGGEFRVTGLDKEQHYQVRAAPAMSTNPGRTWLDEGISARAGDTSLRIVLPKDGGVKGKVAFADGSIPEMFTVRTGWSRGTPFSSKDGAFELRELPPKTVNLTIAGPGFDSKQISGVVVKSAGLTDLGTITVKKGRTIDGIVLGVDGNPVEGAVVAAGRSIFGNGSSIDAGGRGNPMARLTKTAQTDASGQFSIHGASMGDLSIVAESETGRSIATQFQQTRESIAQLSLQLVETSSLGGMIQKDGEPEAGMFVTATPVKSPAVSFNVASGPDGTYRFDRLVPGSYRVKIMLGGSPMSGMSFYAKMVEVVAGRTATLDFDVEVGQTALRISLKSAGALGFTRLAVLDGDKQIKTARELEAVLGQQVGREGFLMSIRGSSVVQPDLSPGPVTVCAAVYPVEVKGMSETMEYMVREGDNLPAQCKSVVIGDSAEQSMTIDVILPEFVPAE